MPRTRDATEDAGDAQLNPQAREVVGIATAAVFLAAIVVLLRIYTRGILLHVLGREDWAMALALLFSIGNTIGMCFQATLALGKHIWTLSQQEKVEFFKAVYFTILSYNLSIALVKVSIVLLYLRVFSLVFIRKATYATLAVVAIISLWSIFSSIFFCVPVAAYWDPSVAGACLPRQPRWLSGAILNILSDFMIFALPLPAVRRLRLPTRQKIGLYVVFTLGFFVCVVSIIRLIYLIDAAKTKDPSGDNPMVAKWSIIELNTAIICASLITLKPLILHFFPGFLGSKDSDKYDHTHQDLFYSLPPPTIGSGRAAEHSLNGRRDSASYVHHIHEILGSNNDTQGNEDALQRLGKNAGVKVIDREHDGVK